MNEITDSMSEVKYRVIKEILWTNDLSRYDNNPAMKVVAALRIDDPRLGLREAAEIAAALGLLDKENDKYTISKKGREIMSKEPSEDKITVSSLTPQELREYASRGENAAALKDAIHGVIAENDLLDKYPPIMAIVVAFRILSPGLGLKEAREIARDAGFLNEKILGEFTLSDEGHEFIKTCGVEVDRPAMKIINLTPHEVRIRTSEGEIAVPPSGTVARCAEERLYRPPLRIEGKDVPVSLAAFGEVEGLPEPRPNTIFIVSAIVLAAVPERKDVFSPGPAIRDAEGRVVACAGLSCGPAYPTRRGTIQNPLTGSNSRLAMRHSALGRE